MSLDYIGRCCECDRVVAWTSSEISPKELARIVADNIRCGLSIERMETEDVRTIFGHADGCAQKRRKKPDEKQLF